MARAGFAAKVSSKSHSPVDVSIMRMAFGASVQ